MPRAILIDPFEQTLTDVWLTADDDGSTLKSLYEHLQCGTINIVSVGKDSLGQGVDLVIDDDGRAKDYQRCFQMGGENGLLVAGRAALVSCNDMGETTSCGLSIEQATSQIAWLPEEVDYEPPQPVIQTFDTFEEMQAVLAAMRR